MDGGHYVTEDRELKKVAVLHASFEHKVDFLCAELVDHTQALVVVADELGHVVVKVLIQKLEVLLDVRTEFLDVKEDLPEALLYFREGFGELDVSHASDHVISHRVVLVAQQDGELGVLWRRHHIVFV